MFKKITFTIQRLTDIAGGNKQDYQPINETLFGILEPVDAEFAALSGGSYGKSFRIYSSKLDTTVEETDRLIAPDGREFEVRGVIKYTDHPPKHIEVMVEKVIKQ